MKRIVVLLFFIFSLQNAFSQEFEMIRHQVKMGETVRMISRKYKIEPSEIYRLNKFAVDGISQGMVLQLMVPKKEEIPQDEVVQTDSPPAEEPKTNTVEVVPNPDESVSSSSTTTKKTTTVRKKKPVTDQQVESTSPEEPSVVTSTSSETSETTASHTVAKGETLFSIAKRYGVTVDEVKAQNAVLQRKGLQPGQVLTISSKSGSTVVEKVPDNVVKPTATTSENSVPSNSASTVNVTHTVVKGDTLYSLSRKYNVSVEAIKIQNEQALKKGLQIGQVIIIGVAN